MRGLKELWRFFGHFNSTSSSDGNSYKSELNYRTIIINKSAMQLDLHEELCSYLRALLKAIMGGWGGREGRVIFLNMEYFRERYLKNVH